MPKKDKEIYDVIIIGAGISGLVCGCYLARAGMKVLIIEHHDKPGGYFTSFRRRGLSFDAAAHSFGNYRKSGHVRMILTELGINKIINIKRFDPSDVIFSPELKITFWNDMKRTIADLASIFPRERDNIVKYFDFVTSANPSEFMKLKDKTFSSLLHSFFEDEKLINLIAAPVFGSGGLPPSSMHSFIGSKIFSEFVLDGGYYPVGGIQNLPNALEYVLRQNNGNILYRTLVKKICLKNRSATGVELDNNKALVSRYVVSACDMTQTLRTFLGRKVIGTQTISSLKKMTPSLSFFILYLGLKKSFKGLPPEGANIWYLPHYDLDKIYHNTNMCHFEAVMYLIKVSPDKKTLLASFLAPFKTKTFWRRHKKRVAEQFLRRIDEFIPNLKKHLSYFDAATPATLYRYTLNYKGAAFGWAKTPSQVYEPIMSKTTSFHGLYMTGHWTSVSFGLPGTCYSGYDTAKRILRKEKINISLVGNKENY